MPWAARPLCRWARSALWSWWPRPGPAPQAGELQAFVTDGRQGVVLAPGTWHHALLAVEGGDFVVVERRAAVVDCEVCRLNPGVQLRF